MTGPFWVDTCHGWVGGPAVIGPTGTRGFINEPGAQQKAEALCDRLNAAWREFGATIEFLRVAREKAEAEAASLRQQLSEAEAEAASLRQQLSEAEAAREAKGRG